MDKFKETIYGIVNRTAENTLLHANANKDSKRIPVMRDLVAGEVAKHLALTELLPEDVAQAHIKGDIHWHDADYSPLFPMVNCCIIDLEGMLTRGFKMGNAEITQPRSISTAAAVAAQIIAQVASHIYGGNTLNRLDETFAPYVRKSYEKHLATGKLWLKDQERAVAYATQMTEKETYDAMQSMEYEINTLHTANGQTPFCTIGFGLGTSWEARLVQKSILNVRRAGLGKSKRTAVFPKLVFTVRKGVNFKDGDVNYDIKQLALQCASERMYPDILNYDTVVKTTGGFVAPMGCRSFLAPWVDSDGNTKYSGRNNLGVVSLNLPRIAIEAERDMDRFWNLLEERAELAKRALMFRIKGLEGVKANVAPILFVEGAFGVRLNPEDEILPIFKDGRASISMGYIGLHEMAMLMMGQETHILDDIEKQKFCTKVVGYLKEMADTWRKETGYGFSLYSTPSESLCDRFCRLDVQHFGVVEGVHEKGYYTNSFHLDVEKKTSPSLKIDFESPYAPFASGGHITYVELPDMKRFLPALEWVWDYSYDKVPYLGINTPVDYCGKCDFFGETVASTEGFKCPSCGCSDSKYLQVTRRVCGYLGSPNARPFIEGKQKEVIGRIKHHSN